MPVFVFYDSPLRRDCQCKRQQTRKQVNIWREHSLAVFHGIAVQHMAEPGIDADDKFFLVYAMVFVFGDNHIQVFFGALADRHAIERPLDPMVVAFLFSPGIGELGFSTLIKATKEKVVTGFAEAKISALQAELEASKPKPGKRNAAATEAESPKATVAPRELKQVRSMLEQMLPSLVGYFSVN